MPHRDLEIVRGNNRVAKLDQLNQFSGNHFSSIIVNARKVRLRED
jgi:hypothetical protein